MRRRIVVICLLLLCNQGFAQVTIEECYALAKQNYPLAKQRGLIEQAQAYNLSNAQKGYLPQFVLSAQGTYQTEVISIPTPGFRAIPKDQYVASVQLNQTVWDGGVIRSQKQGIEAASEVDTKRLEADLYALNDRINGLYFGALLLDEQIALNELLQTELQRDLDKVTAYVASGIANGADVDAVQAELLTNRQQRVELTTTREAYLQMLSALVGESVREVVKPALPAAYFTQNNRPELALFEAQIAQAESKRSAISARNMPHLDFFVQGAYGNPGLNMLNPGFTPYAIGGLKLSWNFGGLYTRKHDIQNIGIQRQSIDAQREAFLLNTDMQVTQTNAGIEKLKQQMQDDDQIIALRNNIRESAQAKVSEGTLSVRDMLREVTALHNAMQTKSIHEVQLLMAFYDLKYATNN